MADSDDDIPTLRDILRPGGDGKRAGASDDASDRRSELPLSDAEIEAIAHRVIERHTERMQDALTRAIRKAIELKSQQRGSDDETDEPA